ncbi:MAG: translation initiation factor IF-3 [Thermodesulfobacteriota bacterium]|nr:translation initiation factor IF-3 [Deltaproteobacteria bacterium TMED58]RZP16599.1 MAG: translation initiation factor IF-3 [Candidatus Dadabacteria bacterium]
MKRKKSSPRKPLQRINTSIRAKEVRLIGLDGSQVGIVSIDEALKAARSSSTDLVEISPDAKPPVCKVMDYGKFLYDQKKQQASQKKTKAQVLKEIKFRPNIGENDFNVKINRLKDFLADGHKVKIRLWFKGREIVHKSIGEELVAKIIDTVSESGELDNEPKFEGKNLTLMVLPKKLKAVKKENVSSKNEVQ